MRPIHGAAPGVSAADHFTAMRDNPALARPANPSEAVAVADLHAPMPPSRALLKRIKRNGQGLVPPPRAYPPASAEVRHFIDVQREFHKKVIADLGGSRTIVGSNEERRVVQREPGHTAPPPAPVDCPKAAAAKRRAHEEAILEAARRIMEKRNAQ